MLHQSGRAQGPLGGRLGTAFSAASCISPELSAPSKRTSPTPPLPPASVRSEAAGDMTSQVGLIGLAVMGQAREREEKGAAR